MNEKRKKIDIQSKQVTRRRPEGFDNSNYCVSEVLVKKWGGGQG